MSFVGKGAEMSRVKSACLCALAVSAIVLSVLGMPARCCAELVGYWNFDGNVFDHSGQENHGDLVDGSYENDVPSVLGAGQSLSFEDPLAHVFVDANDTLDSNVFTLSLFFNDRGQINGINRLTSRESDTFETGIDQVFGTGSLAYYSPVAGIWTATNWVPEIDVWHHAAFVVDGTQMSIFVDGEQQFGPVPFRAAPSGYMHIGNRHNDIEGFDGLIDDVALWNVALDAAGIADLAAGRESPLTVKEPEPPVLPTIITVGSNVETWRVSTASIDGGEPADWDPSGDPPPPNVSTFTLEPMSTAPAVIPHINGVANVLGVQGIAADADVHYYRTTFNLDTIDSISAEIQMAIDNGVQVYLNGERIATETSFLVENWGFPLPSVSIAENGAISVVKFEESADSFTHWRVGENEVVLAVRNPFTEANPAGGFAFRMNILIPDSGMAGDFNGDGELSVADINLLTAASASGANDPKYDLNNDSLVNADDVTVWAKNLKNTWIGDADVNGEFNSADFVQAFSAGKYETQQAAVWSEGDWNGSGTFDSSDFVAAFSDGGYEQGLRPGAVNAVPEPIGYWLLAIGIPLLLMGRRTCGAI